MVSDKGFKHGFKKYQYVRHKNGGIYWIHIVKGRSLRIIRHEKTLNKNLPNAIDCTPKEVEFIDIDHV